MLDSLRARREYTLVTDDSFIQSYKLEASSRLSSFDWQQIVFSLPRICHIGLDRLIDLVPNVSANIRPRVTAQNLFYSRGGRGDRPTREALLVGWWDLHGDS